MPIDPQRLNFAHNDLKNLAGERGAFVLFLVSGEGADRDVQIRFVGDDLKVTGLLEQCAAYVREFLSGKFSERMKRLPTEPD